VLAALITQTNTKMSELVLPFMFNKLELDNEEVTTCRMQQDIFEWLVHEFILMM